MFILFLFVGRAQGNHVDSRDTATFRNMMLIVVAVGGVSSLAFFFLVKEPDDPRNDVIIQLC